MTDDINAMLTLSAATVASRVRVLPPDAQKVDAQILELVLALGLRPLRGRWGRHGRTIVARHGDIDVGLHGVTVDATLAR